jgi:hypothetical protein
MWRTSPPWPSAANQACGVASSSPLIEMERPVPAGEPGVTSPAVRTSPAGVLSDAEHLVRIPVHADVTEGGELEVTAEDRVVVGHRVAALGGEAQVRVELGGHGASVRSTGPARAVVTLLTGTTHRRPEDQQAAEVIELPDP